MQIKVAAAGLMAAYSLLEMCPAPVAVFIPLIAEMAGAVAGVAVHISGGKRDVNGFSFEADITTKRGNSLDARASCMPTPKGVPENVIQNCCDSLHGAHITVKGSQSSKSKCAG